MKFTDKDAYWNKVLDFLSANTQAKDKIVAPSEFQPFFSNFFDYTSTFSENIKVEDFDWVIVHKGNLAQIELSLLWWTLYELKPVFANEVFVVFTQSTIQETNLNKVHIEVLWEKLKTRKEKNSQLQGETKINRTDSVYLGNYIALAKTIFDHKIYVDTRDISLAPHILIDGYWERWITDFFLKLLNPGMTVVEVGANIGYYSLLAASKIGNSGHLYAFEANPYIFPLLKNGLEINGFTENSTVINKAVSNKNGTAEFIIFNDTMGDSKLKQTNENIEKDYKVEEVISTTLDHELNMLNQIDLLKIDAEGAEPLIVQGADRILKTNNKIKVIMEFAPNLFFANKNEAKQHIDMIKELGFNINVIHTDSKCRSIPDSELYEGHHELFLFR